MNEGIATQLTVGAATFCNPDLDLGESGVVASKLPAPAKIHVEQVAEQHADHTAVRHPEHVSLWKGCIPPIEGAYQAVAKFGDRLASRRRNGERILLPASHQIGRVRTNFGRRLPLPLAHRDLT